MYDIPVTLTTNPKKKPEDESKLGFGKIFTDHMFIMDYEQGRGWYDARVVPYGPFVMDPACTVFHYAQEIFEGMKCYRRKDGGLNLFRPRDNFARMNRSAERMGMPKIDVEEAMAGLTALLKVGCGLGAERAGYLAVYPSDDDLYRCDARRSCFPHVSLLHYLFSVRRVLRQGSCASRYLCGAGTGSRGERRRWFHENGRQLRGFDSRGRYRGEEGL